MVKKYKKVIIIIALAVVCASYISRVYYVNANTDRCKVKEYAKGEIVPFEKDFNRASNMIIDGYSVKVLDTELYTKEEFISKYEIKSEVEDVTKYIYTVDVRFYNENKEDNTQAGIYLLFMPLITSVDYIMPDSDMTLAVNPKLPGDSFSLRHESEMDVKIVYRLIETHFTSKKQVISKDFDILITQYPKRKVLKAGLKK